MAKDAQDHADLFGNGPNPLLFAHGKHRAVDLRAFAHDENPAETAVKFLESLNIPEGPSAGELVRLAPFQKQFVAGAMADGIAAAVLSIGRGNAKTALSAGIALGGLIGVWDNQARREMRHHCLWRFSGV